LLNSMFSYWLFDHRSLAVGAKKFHSSSIQDAFYV
jgi:hypothetical protein